MLRRVVTASVVASIETCAVPWWSLASQVSPAEVRLAVLP
jgi:hypothetical protein